MKEFENAKVCFTEIGIFGESLFTCFASLANKKHKEELINWQTTLFFLFISVNFVFSVL